MTDAPSQPPPLPLSASGASASSPDAAAVLGQIGLLSATLAASGPQAFKRPGAWADRPLPSSGPDQPIWVRLPLSLVLVNIPPAQLAALLRQAQPVAQDRSRCTVTVAPPAAAPAAAVATPPGPEAVLAQLRRQIDRQLAASMALRQDYARARDARLDSLVRTSAALVLGSTLPAKDAVGDSRLPAPAPPPRAVSSPAWAALLAALTRAEQQLGAIAQGNAGLSGSGTVSDPYAGTTLYAMAPLTVGVVDVTPAQLKMTQQGTALHLEAAP